MWYGLWKITAVYSHLVYGVTSLHDGKTDCVHCARLIKYRDSLLGKLVPQSILDFCENTGSCYEVAKPTKDVSKDCDDLFFRVQWEDYPTCAIGLDIRNPNSTPTYRTWLHLSCLHISSRRVSSARSSASSTLFESRRPQRPTDLMG